MKSFLLLVLAPLCSLLLVLAWAYLVAKKRDELRVVLKGFGLSLDVHVKPFSVGELKDDQK